MLSLGTQPVLVSQLNVMAFGAADKVIAQRARERDHAPVALYALVNCRQALLVYL